MVLFVPGYAQEKTQDVKQLENVVKTMKDQQNKALQKQRRALGNAVGSPNQQAATPPAMQAAQAIDESAFRQVLRTLMPLSTQQVNRLRKRYNETEQATSSPIYKPPKPTSTSQMINLAPGATPPVIRLAQGFITSLVFIDTTGADWPVADYDLGNPQAFNIQWDKKGNTLLIQATKLYTYGNLAVRLRGLSTPVMITLIPGQSAVDYRVDMRVPGFGPKAKTVTFGPGLPNTADSLLLSILDGVPPPGGKLLQVSSSSAKAWLASNIMYIRTRLNVLSPGWLSTMSSADGMHVYKMQKTPLVLVSNQGKLMRLRIKGL